MPTPTSSDRGADKTGEDSFPASDPPANSGITGVGRPDRPAHIRPIDEQPTGTPNSDRHGIETAYQREDEESPAEKRRGEPKSL